jgi:cell division protein FtsX
MGLMLSILRQLWRQLFSQLRLQLMTILSLAVSLSILALLLLFLFNIQQATQAWSVHSQLFVLLTPMEDDALKAFETELKTWGNIENIQVNSSADAIKSIQELLGNRNDIMDRHGANAEVNDGMMRDMEALKNEIFFNPSFEISIKEVSAVALVQLKEKLKQDQRVEEVKVVAQESFVLQGIQEMKEILGLVLWVVSLWVTASISFMVYHLVRLNLYSRRQEIEVLNSIGAENFFIQLPLALEASIQVFLAHILSIIAIEFLFKSLQAIMKKQIFAFQLMSFMDFPKWGLLLYTSLVILIAVITSLLSSGHFLRQRIQGQL